MKFPFMAVATGVACLAGAVFTQQAAAQSAYNKRVYSGLSVVGAFPTSRDICVLVRSTKAIKKYAQPGRRFIACPRNESGAIRDRKNAGARQVAKGPTWVLLTVR